jgi:hypothetical protein
MAVMPKAYIRKIVGSTLGGDIDHCDRDLFKNSLSDNRLFFKTVYYLTKRRKSNISYKLWISVELHAGDKSSRITCK